MRYLIFFIILSFVTYGQKIDFEQMKLGKRTDNYRAWVYLKDKNGSNPVYISEKAIERRKKNGVSINEFWHDLSVSEFYIDQISSIGLIIKNHSRWLNAVSVIGSKSDLVRITKFSFVDRIEPVIGYKRKPLIKYNDIDPNSRDFDYGNAYEQIEQINVHLLHEQGYTGQGVRILLLDTGFNLEHNALNNINVIAQWDVINNDFQTANETEEEENIGQDHHGTAVLSTIAANAPGEFIGVAFQSEFLLAKTEDVSQEIQQEEDNYVAALEWGEANGADVVSTSLGYLDWYEYSDLDGNTATTTIGVDIAVGLGMVCVTAAGNSGDDEWYYIIAPADADSVIAVGAVRDNNEIAGFSSHGPTADGRIKPEVCARGVQTWCISPSSTTLYTQYSGTSLACPLVGGVAALIIQARPDWSAIKVRESLMMTASMSDSANNNYGYGIVNASNAVNFETLSEIDNQFYHPSTFNISKVYPNPFNPSINIEIAIASINYLTIDILSHNGNYIKTLFKGRPNSDIVKIKWEPKNLPSGIYFVRLNYNGYKKYKKVTYLK